ncbi:ABC transporter permease [Curtobacterium sp. MCBD17_034]|uniref:ABC transporter permease n=1 Tax=unclassified Curtobacterium TaxID=257496 RepID=UPI000DA7EE1B|nr:MULTISPECIES: ABC transporter permease [unclassified Curtobacterium]PZE78493.1 ABC transporter permease [Curtobacterium sp. MCBD17_019]PZF57122.1 ABC transporter permease [Curtobacterium sp. MCBD17_034]PZM33529.1 ABC transporter permease [Curtobacterium sp. MCBD17_031]
MLARLIRLPSFWVGTGVLALVVLLGVFGHLLAPHDPLQGGSRLLAAPSAAHPLGTDYLGRDVLSRLLAGAPASVLSAFEVAAIALVVGTVPGLLSVYLGRVFEWLSLRVVDTLIALPFLVFAVAMTALLGNGLTQAMFSVGILLAPMFYRVSRAAALSVSGSQFVEAAVLSGASTGWVLRKHIAPKVVAPVGIAFANATGVGLVIVASLTFLGIGVQPPAPTWGGMLASDLGYLSYQPYAPVWPIVLIMATVWSLNLLADVLRDASGESGRVMLRRRALERARRRARGIATPVAPVARKAGS